jgi:GNAT superfamily N-acetyltransferase
MTTTRDAVAVERTTNTAEAASLGALIADAFLDLPPSRWLLSSQDDRNRILPEFFALYVDHGIRAGLVHTTPERSAVDIWFPGASPQPLDDLPRLARLTGPHFLQFVLFDYILGQHHPALRPHQWLAILAVAPEVQGRGIGTALLDHHHRFLDDHDQAAYLEAANLADRDYYRARGWHDLGQPIVLPDGPPMFPMWRDPHAAFQVGTP